MHPRTAPARPPPSTPGCWPSSPRRSRAPARWSGSADRRRGRGDRPHGHLHRRRRHLPRLGCRAAGLEPCTVGDRAPAAGSTFTVASIARVRRHVDGGAALGRLGAGHAGAPAIGRRSRRHRRGGEPARARLRRTGQLDFAIDTGRAWEFPDAASAARFLHGRRGPACRRRGGSATSARCEPAGRRGRTSAASRFAGVEATAEGAPARARPRADDALHARASGDEREGLAPGRRRRRRAVARRGDDRVHARAHDVREIALPDRRSGAAAGQVIESSRGSTCAIRATGRRRRAAARPAPGAARRAGRPRSSATHRPAGDGRARGLRGPRRLLVFALGVKLVAELGLEAQGRRRRAAARRGQRLDARFARALASRTASRNREPPRGTS